MSDRLAAAFDRARRRAESDLADGRLATESIARGHRGARRAPLVRAGLVLAAVAVLGVGTLWAVGGHPSASPAPSAAGVPSTPHESFAATEASGSEIPQVLPSDEGILYVDQFPATVSGAPVYPVGPEANAAIAAASDSAPLLISGWLVGASRGGCVQDFDMGTPTPDGVYFKDCAGTPLAATPDGGDALRVYFHFDQLSPGVFPVHATVAEVQHILLRVHVHDHGCGAADCQRKPVVDATVMLSQPALSPAVVAQTMPPKIIPITTAIGLARPLAAEMLSTGDFVLVRVQAGPVTLFADQVPQDQYGPWVYALTFDTPDGHSYATIYVDAVTGAAPLRLGGTGGDGLTSP